MSEFHDQASEENAMESNLLGPLATFPVVDTGDAGVTDSVPLPLNTKPCRLLYSRASLELCVEFVVKALLIKAEAAEAEAFRISQMAAGRPETEAGMRWYAGNLRSIAAEFRATEFVEAVVDSIRNVS